MCIWEQDVVRWRHSLHARPVHLQRTCNHLRQPSQANSHHAHRARKRKPSSWHLGSWNVRSMVDTEGLVEIASSREDKGRRQECRFDHARNDMVQCEGDCTAGDQVVWD